MHRAFEKLGPQERTDVSHLSVHVTQVYRGMVFDVDQH